VDLASVTVRTGERGDDSLAFDYMHISCSMRLSRTLLSKTLTMLGIRTLRP